MRNLSSEEAEPPSDDRWTLVEGEDNGLPLILRIREQVPHDAKPAEYPHLIAISWPYEPANEHGMPSPDLTESMAQFENLLDSALEAPRAAFLTVIVTGNGTREWQWYSRDPDETMNLVNEALTGYEPFPVQFSVQEDPGWEAYLSFQDLGQ